MFNLLISSHWHSTSHHSYLPGLLLSPVFPLSLSVCVSCYSLISSLPLVLTQSAAANLSPFYPQTCANLTMSMCSYQSAHLLWCICIVCTVWVWSFLEFNILSLSWNQTERRRHSESNFKTLCVLCSQVVCVWIHTEVLYIQFPQSQKSGWPADSLSNFMLSKTISEQS